MEPAVPWDGRPREVPALCEDHGPGISATPLVRAPVTTPPYHAHVVGDTCRTSRFLGSAPASLWVGRPAGVARPFRVVPPLDHHGEPALSVVVLKRPPARTRGYWSHRSPVAHLATTH